MNAFRTTFGGRIDRDSPLQFTFDGKDYEGLAGDTLASALLANGVHFVGRSFKYHRPRGVVAAGSEEPNALAGIDRGPGRYTPNNRMTTATLYDGLTASSQNRWPSLNFDVGALNQFAAPVLSAGFYYKTFMWPKSFWASVYEPFIRRAAGLGRASTDADQDSYTTRFAHCDVLIIGAGPVGLSAALAESETGAAIILVDEQDEPGGGLLSEPSTHVEGTPAWDWLDDAMTTLRNRNNVTILARTTAFGFYHRNFLGLTQRLTDHQEPNSANGPRERLWRVRAKQVVLATGAIERPVVFPNNDRPGIMLAGAARTYLNRYGVRVGRRAAIVTSADSAYEGAFDLAQQGVEIVAIIDSRQDVSSALRERAQALGVEVLANHTVLSAKGRRRVSGLAVAPVFNCEGEAQAKKSSERLIDCDVVLMSGGWTPSLHLYSQAGGAIVWREDLGGFTPDSSRPMAHVRCEGACNGDFNFGKASLFINDEAGGSGKAFVDFQNDVTADDIRLAVREGFHSIEHIKRYTTNGMATDQGKLANINALAIAAEAAGRPIPEIGLTTFRPPYTPITFGVLAGHRRDGLYDSQRKTPLDDWAVEHGAVFEPVGQWRRARYFPLPGEDIRAAVARECRITRKSLGLFDASTLGKIEVVGPDAAEFLNRIYTNNVASLAPGRCRYGLMLGENGFILDDGIVARLSEDRFHITTTTSGAAHVLTMMEDYLQTEWPELQCWLTSVTEHWAVIAVNGPNSRKLLAPLVDGVDLDGKVFPHMSVCDATVCGVPARLFRVSFTGELGFEINVPSGHAMAVWKQLLEAGNAFDGGVYGTETMHVLRAEKGYIIVGQETDGTVTPDDVGMNWIVSKNKSDFVGKRSLTRPDIDAPNRKQLVGLKTDAPNIVLEEGLQVTEASGALPDAKSIGYVTSAYWSETIQRSIALAMIEDGRNRIGKILNVPIGAQKHPVTIVAPAFYDPTGERLDA